MPYTVLVTPLSILCSRGTINYSNCNRVSGSYLLLFDPLANEVFRIICDHRIRRPVNDLVP